MWRCDSSTASRTARSLGVELTLVCPLRNEDSIDEESREKLAQRGLLRETLDLAEGIDGADYVYTDTWLDMEFFNDPKFAEEKERRIELMMPYQIEMKIDGDGPCLSEIGARLPGGNLPVLASKLHGRSILL